MLHNSEIFLSDPIARHHPLNRGRVAWWLTVPGLEGGRQFYDLMGLNHATLINGPLWKATARQGGWGHLAFDGTDDYCNIGAVDVLALSIGTISAWVNLIAAPGSFSVICQRTRNDSSNNGSPAFLVSPSRQLNFAMQGGGVSEFVNITTTATLTTGVWYHVAVTWNASTAVIYINGAASTSGAVTGTITLGTTFWSAIAARKNQTSGLFERFLNCSQDSISAWSRDLSASEVFEDYTLSRMGYPGVLNFHEMPMLGSSFSRLLSLRRRMAVAA